MRSAAAVLLFAVRAFGLCINAGGPRTLFPDGVSVDCLADAMFTGGAAYIDTNATAADSLADLRYGTTFSYTIPAQPGFYVLSLSFVDPNVTAPGGRVFYATVNGQRTPNIDLAVLTGGTKMPYVMRLPVISYGQVVVSFTTLVRSAIINEIRLDVIPQVSGVPASTLNPGTLALALSDGSYAPVNVVGDPPKPAVAGVIILRSCAEPFQIDACLVDSTKPTVPQFQWAYTVQNGIAVWVPIYSATPYTDPSP